HGYKGWHSEEKRTLKDIFLDPTYPKKLKEVLVWENFGDYNNNIGLCFSKIAVKNLNAELGVLENWRNQLSDKLNEQGDDKNKHLKALENFISEKRISSLKEVKNQNFDLKKLLKLCEELNQNYKSGNYFSVLFLSRAIKDHVPPIFKCKNFLEVCNNSKISSSSKKNFLHLQNSLKNISDGFLHSKISKSEILPEKETVEFRADFDVLICEILKKLK
ncbi:MAG: hypothetical protein ABIE14_02450, partial [Patescibacteria group bacterium]